MREPGTWDKVDAARADVVRKSDQFLVRVSTSDRLQYQAAAIAEGLSLSAWVRKQCQAAVERAG